MIAGTPSPFVTDSMVHRILELRAPCQGSLAIILGKAEYKDWRNNISPTDRDLQNLKSGRSPPELFSAASGF